MRCGTVSFRHSFKKLGASEMEGISKCSKSQEGHRSSSVIHTMGVGDIINKEDLLVCQGKNEIL